MAGKKNWLTILVAVLIFGITVTSCDIFNNPDDGLKDTITIISVSPNNGLIDGKETEFTIVVEYSLLTQAQGEINIRFNNGDKINSWRNDSSHTGWTAQIKKGSGTRVLTTSAAPKDWKSEGDFSVWALLDPYPHGDRWTALAMSEKEILTFTN